MTVNRTTTSRRRFLNALTTKAQRLEAEVGTFGPRSVPPELRRDHLLTCATIAFVSDGFEGTSMQSIARQAGVTKPVIYGFFASKEDLFAAVVDRANDELAVEMESAVAERGESRLGPGVRAYLQHLSARVELWGQLLTSTHHHAVGEAARRLRDRQVAIVASALARGYEDAGLNADPRQVDALAHFISGAVDAVGNWWLATPDIDLDTVVDFLERAITPSLQAIRSDTAPTWPSPSRRRSRT